MNLGVGAGGEKTPAKASMIFLLGPTLGMINQNPQIIRREIKWVYNNLNVKRAKQIRREIKWIYSMTKN